MFEKFDTFHLNAKFFPEATKKALPTAVILQYGALPLGYKTSFSLFKKAKILNLGFLNPGKPGALSRVLEECRKSLGLEAFSDAHIYRLKPEEFVEALGEIYHIYRETLYKMPQDSIDATLLNYLHT